MKAELTYKIGEFKEVLPIFRKIYDYTLKEHNNYYARQRCPSGMYPSNWEQCLVEGFAWMTSENNSLIIKMSRINGQKWWGLSIKVEGRRHGIPWWCLNEMSPQVNDTGKWKVDSMSSQRMDLKPWETAT